MTDYVAPVVGLALGVGLFFTACGGGEPAATGDAPAAAQAGQQSSSVDPCALVTGAEASEALGATAGPGERPKEANHPLRMVTCRYTAPRGQGVAVMTVLVQQSDTPSQARIGFQSAKEQFPGAEAVPGLGDEAFAMANQLNVLQGTRYLNITGDFDLPTARTLAQRALQRLR